MTPDNIYITKDGMVKLLDFGSARYSIGDKSKSLDVILKVGYAPKEQYIRRSRQGPFTDVYSCAACFYAALTGNGVVPVFHLNNEIVSQSHLCSCLHLLIGSVPSSQDGYFHAEYPERGKRPANSRRQLTKTL